MSRHKLSVSPKRAENMSPPKQVALDTSMLVGLVDSRDVWHHPALCYRIIGIVIPEDEVPPSSIVIGIFDYTRCRLDNKKFFEVKL